MRHEKRDGQEWADMAEWAKCFVIEFGGDDGEDVTYLSADYGLVQTRNIYAVSDMDRMALHREDRARLDAERWWHAFGKEQR